MSSPNSCSKRGAMYLRAFQEQKQQNDNIAELKEEMRSVVQTNRLLHEQIHQLQAEIDKVGEWFTQEAPELIEEGSACDLAVRWLNYFALEKDVPVPASPDVLEPDFDEEAHY